MLHLTDRIPILPASLRQLANAQHGAVFLGPTRTASTARQRRAWQSTSPTSNRPHRTATPTPGPRGDVRPLGKHNRSYIQFSVLRSGGTRTDSVLRQSPLGKRDIRWVVPPSSRLAGSGGRCGGAGLHRLRCSSAAQRAPGFLTPSGLRHLRAAALRRGRVVFSFRLTPAPSSPRPVPPKSTSGISDAT